jgi:flagellar basal body rod protein FlgC
MDPISIALQGLQQADVQLNAAASRLANAGDSPNGANLDVVDIGAEMVALMSAQTMASVNIATLKTADQMQKALVDIKA